MADGLVVKISAEIDEPSFEAAIERLKELDPDRGMWARIKKLFQPRKMRIAAEFNQAALAGELVQTPTTPDKDMTLREKLAEYARWIDTFTDSPEEIADGILSLLGDHFMISGLELAVGEVVIKSDNNVENSSVKIGDRIIPVRRIQWTLEADEMHGKLTLGF